MGKLLGPKDCLLLGTGLLLLSLALHIQQGEERAESARRDAAAQASRPARRQSRVLVPGYAPASPSSNTSYASAWNAPGAPLRGASSAGRRVRILPNPARAPRPVAARAPRLVQAAPPAVEESAPVTIPAAGPDSEPETSAPERAEPAIETGTETRAPVPARPRIRADHGISAFETFRTEAWSFVSFRTGWADFVFRPLLRPARS